MEKREQLYEGKAKILYATDDPNLVVAYFKDDATAFNAEKKGTIHDKGIVNNAISSKIFPLLEKNGIRTHFVEQLSEREMLCKRLDIILVETIGRNVVAGSLAKRTGLDEGTRLKTPIVEYYYKDDDLGDPMITDDHIAMLELATPDEMSFIREQTFIVNDVLKKFFASIGIDLVDFKLEYGRHGERGEVILGDEICPDTCRLWDLETSEKLDKDRFRRDLGKVEEASSGLPPR